MTLEQLKNDIINNCYNGCPIVFVYSDSKFVPTQYVDKIVQDNNYTVDYKYDVDGSIISSIDLFGQNITDQYIRVYDVDVFDYCDSRLLTEKNIFVICKKVSDEAESMYKDLIINVPKLEDWQIKDYVYSLVEGIKESDLNRLISLCRNNIYRIESEIAKIILFKSELRQKLFSEFELDGVFSDLSDSTIFDLSDAILKRDSKKLAYVYKQLDCMDVNPVGLINLLYQSIKNIIKIQLIKNSTPESSGIAKNKFFAIKYNYIGKYNKQQLVKIFLFLTELDKQIKLGLIDVDNIVDQLIVFIFSV